MSTNVTQHGIELRKAPELKVKRWIDENGNEINPIQLSNYEGKFKVIYCFQHWCSGCHSHGLPSLQKMVNALRGNNKVIFLAIQTVFEGNHANTFDKIIETQKKYDLKIPFGHDEGSEETHNISSVMHDYRTGGTPWFILIDQKGNVVFNDFQLNAEKAIEFLKTL